MTCFYCFTVNKHLKRAAPPGSSGWLRTSRFYSCLEFSGLAARLHPTQHQQQIYSALHLVHPTEKLICWLKKFFIFQPEPLMISNHLVIKSTFVPHSLAFCRSETSGRLNTGSIINIKSKLRCLFFKKKNWCTFSVPVLLFYFLLRFCGVKESFNCRLYKSQTLTDIDGAEAQIIQRLLAATAGTTLAPPLFVVMTTWPRPHLLLQDHPANSLLGERTMTGRDDV